MSAGAYLLAIAELAIIVTGLGLGAVALRRRVLPGWEGAPARLVESIAAVAVAVWIGELLGVVGLFTEVVYLLCCAGTGAALALLLDRPEAAAAARPPAPPVPLGLTLVTIGIVAVVFAHWGLEIRQSLDAGIGNFDSLWYHMPFSTEIAQSGSTTALQQTDTVFVNWFYPQNSELLHAIGILLSDRDTLSLFVNLGWLAVALLAAWCAGRPYGRGPLTVAAAAIVLECHTLVVREPGAAKNDAVAAALLLAAAAIVINAWEASRSRGDGDRDGGPALIGWPLAAAGLAAGLAAGTKVTVLAAVAALTVAVLALAPAGRRRAAAGWWFAPLFAGGAFWYLRNLVSAANPIPQIEQLGPISLPGPERLQTGRPDFTVLHYATDTGVWREFFGPGLERAFGELWPLVLLAAIAGAAIAVFASRNRAHRWIGAVALFGIAAYLVTPLSAAGAEGAPEAFGINIRFVIPALLVGLVLLPLAPGLDDRRRQGALLVVLLGILVLTDRSDAVLRSPERAFGALVAVLAVLVPAALVLARRRGAGRITLAAGLGLLVTATVAIGYPVQRDYLRDRFQDFDPEMNLDTAYRWASRTEDARIGLAGSTAGLLGFGFYGTDLSNQVRYLGIEGPKGAFNALPTCRRFRAAVNAEDLDFLVTAPFLNFIEPSQPIRSPEAGWLRGEPAVQVVNRDGPVTVWKVRGRLDPSGCAELAVPQRQVPMTPQG